MGEFDYEISSICPHCGYDQEAGREEPHYLAPGSVIANRYTIGKAIGSGGFAITYVAWDNYLSVKIAIKEYFQSGLVYREPNSTEVYVQSGVDSENFNIGRRSFIDEAHMLAKLSNLDGIVHVINIIEDYNNTSYIVMEYIDGIDMKKYMMGQKEPLNYIDVSSGVLPVMRSLEMVHKSGIIHKDIAPDNIMMNPLNRNTFVLEEMKIREFTMKLIDFGAAMSANSDDEAEIIQLKPGYAPIEQYPDNEDMGMGAWTDVYAMAASIYHMITGKIPQESAERRKNDNLQPPSALCPGISLEFEAVLMKALSVEPKDRYSSIGEFADEIERIVNKTPHGEVIDEGDGTYEKWRKKVIIISGCSVALLVCILSVVLAVVVTNRSKSALSSNSSNVVIENHAMPDFRGKSFYEVYDTMESEGWNCRVKNRVSIKNYKNEDYQADDVVTQSIPEGTDLGRYSEDERVLELTVISYDDGAEINDDCGKYNIALTPDVTGMSQSAAKKVLKKYGFKVKEKTKTDDGNVDKVISQSMGVKDEPVNLDDKNQITITVGVPTPTTSEQRTTETTRPTTRSTAVPTTPRTTAPRTTAPHTTAPHTTEPATERPTEQITDAPPPPEITAPTAPPTTKAPTTRPPTTNPPTTNPPTTRPPTTKPPTTKPAHEEVIGGREIGGGPPV